jgi:hypothetical protein
MTEYREELRGRLNAAHAEALKVHDSPLRADQVHAQVQQIAASLNREELGEERSARIVFALNDALRVLRRDDDGREAARHLATALSQLEAGPRKPSPFLDD